MRVDYTNIFAGLVSFPGTLGQSLFFAGGDTIILEEIMKLKN